MRLKKRKSKNKSKIIKKHQIHNNENATLSIDQENLIQFAFTSTGEIFQPIRVHYEISKLEKLTKAFSKLRCIVYDTKQDIWIWLYATEVTEVNLKIPPNEENPIILGEFIFKENNEVVLNLRSLDRATKAIVFFDRYISKKIARVTYITIVNRLFSIEEAIGGSITRLDQIFERSDVLVRDPKALTQKLIEIKTVANSYKNGLEAVSNFINEMAKEPEPEIEKFPTNYYRDGIDSLRTSLITHQLVAFQHWKGNTNYNRMDVIKDMMKK